MWIATQKKNTDVVVPLKTEAERDYYLKNPHLARAYTITDAPKPKIAAPRENTNEPKPRKGKADN